MSIYNKILEVERQRVANEDNAKNFKLRAEKNAQTMKRLFLNLSEDEQKLFEKREPETFSIFKGIEVKTLKKRSEVKNGSQVQNN